MLKQWLLFGMFLLPLSFYSQNTAEHAIEELAQKSDFPGFAVAVVNENGIVYEQAFGYADLANRIPYTRQSVQNIGSVSKTFIGVAIVKAIELGFFDLETPINTLLPYEVSNPNILSDTIKIKHLVTHTSGIRDNESVYDKSFLLDKYSDPQSKLYDYMVKEHVIPGRDDVDLTLFLQNYLDLNGKWYSKLNFNSALAGTAYEYSNIASALAAHLIETASKIPFDTFCQKYIFEPLQMTDTSWKLEEAVEKKHVKLYDEKRQYYPLYAEITYPDGSLRTSVSDLSKYLSEMIRGYNGHSELLSQESYKLLFEAQFEAEGLPKNSDAKEPNSGVFWRIKSDGQIGHTGSDLGVTAFMFFNPKTGIGKIFMTNTEFENPVSGESNPKFIKQFVAIWKALDAIKQ